MVSYTLSNTHIIDRFLDKDEIEIKDTFWPRRIDGLIWINPSLQHNYAGPDLFSQIQEYKIQYVTILLDFAKLTVHIESSPLPTKADIVLGLRFLSDLTYTTTNQVLSIKVNG